MPLKKKEMSRKHGLCTNKQKMGKDKEQYLKVH